MKQLYNEGRVVGMGTWESYVRQVLSIDPNADILTEREWLAAIMSINNSMILRIKAGTTKGYHDYVLPEGSDLCSCTYVLGTIFEGSVSCLGTNDFWATRVDDYGRLISNVGSLHPWTPGQPANVPVKRNLEMSDEFRAQCKNYTKISTGLVLQPGEWISNIYQVPLTNESDVELTTETNEVILADMSDQIAAMSFNPDLTKRGFVRILFTEPTDTEFFVLLHGFCHKSLYLSMYGELMGGIHPNNGDFLGPELYPWAAPITFVHNNDMMTIEHEEYQTLLNKVNALDTIVEALTRGQSALSEEAARALAEAQSAIAGLESAAARINALMGEVGNLEAEASQTATRLNSVSNEVNNLEVTTDANMGNLSALRTQNKSSLVAAINETYGETVNALLAR